MSITQDLIIKNYKKDSLNLIELENKIVRFCTQVSFATIVKSTSRNKGINDVLKRSGAGSVLPTAPAFIGIVSRLTIRDDQL